jgi:hypothetical protein
LQETPGCPVPDWLGAGTFEEVYDAAQTFGLNKVLAKLSPFMKELEGLNLDSLPKKEKERKVRALWRSFNERPD